MELLNGKKCNSCGFHMLNPSFACPSCGSDALSDIVFDGSGKIYTFTVVMVGFGHLAEKAPYVLAVVELKEGLKVITIIEGLDGGHAKIELPVKFKRTDEKSGPIFQPA
ncbi:MAG: OB-fold domain-containing protein [Leptospira sp.]|nr:OB-fold domain-containing protein [Leptospira sp.]